MYDDTIFKGKSGQEALYIKITTKNIMSTKRPFLSILIPSIPSRFDRAIKLYNRALDMVGEKEIEVLMLVDNKRRTIGEKREILKNACAGLYFMFVDDDDDIVSIDSLYEACKLEPAVSVISFKQKCRNADGSEYIVTFGLGNAVEHNTEDGRYMDIKRPPFHVCAWHKYFKKYSYPSVNYGEDWGWVEQCLPEAVTEIHIPEVIHSYNFDPKVTEASTESNEVWTNPNNEKKEQNHRWKQPHSSHHTVQEMADGVKRVVLDPDGDAPVAQELSFVETKPPKNDCAIVNLVTSGVQRYMTGQRRLDESLHEHAQGVDYYLFTNESEVGAPLHSENPYAFKLYAIQKVREMGYKRILWVDASVVAVKPVMPIFDWIKEKGIFFEHSGWAAGQWTNDETLKYFGITRDEAMKMPMYSAGFSGFDFDNPISIEFFAEWKEAMFNGKFKGSWDNHRHDMSCGSIIANKRELTHLYAQCTEFFSYIGPGYTPNPDSIFQLIGL